jgi:hypothetical protein
MVDRPGVFDTLLAWHPLSMAPNKTPFQCLYSTFDPLFSPEKQIPISKEARDLLDFNTAGYRYDAESSTEAKPVFLRSEAAAAK